MGNEFRRLAAGAVCVLAVADLSDNLLWEFAWLRQAGLEQKRFLLTRLEVYPRSRGWKNRVRYVLTLIVTDRISVTGVKREKPTPWPQVRDAMARAGYALPEADPEPGAALGFNSDRRHSAVFRSAHLARVYRGHRAPAGRDQNYWLGRGSQVAVLR
jgi:hypothetical protein